MTTAVLPRAPDTAVRPKRLGLRKAAMMSVVLLVAAGAARFGGARKLEGPDFGQREMR